MMKRIPAKNSNRSIASWPPSNRRPDDSNDRRYPNPSGYLPGQPPSRPPSVTRPRLYPPVPQSALQYANHAPITPTNLWTTPVTVAGIPTPPIDLIGSHEGDKMPSIQVMSDAAREFMAELLGTLVLTCLGTSVNAVCTLAGITGAYGAIGWGMALTAAIFVSGGVSGGHVNPAVTLAMATVGKLPWFKVPTYFLAQYLGAFLGAALTFAAYREAILAKFEGLYVEGQNATAGIFGTTRHPLTPVGSVAIDQLVASSFFLLLISAITDERNMQVPKGLIPPMIGITDLGLIILAFGYNSGCPINSARDLSPRFLSAIAGYGWGVFDAYCWLPLVTCHVGGILGCWLYRLMIEMHWPALKTV